MSIEIRVPDIGDFDAVDVIEVLIAEGDNVEQEQSVLVLESDKASIEVPANSAGLVKQLLVKVGDQVKQGDIIAILEESSANTTNDKTPLPDAIDPTNKNTKQVVDIIIPDIGDFEQVDVIEVNIVEGDNVKFEQALVTLESDKASMEVPAAHAGIVIKLTVKVGDKVASGDVIGQIETSTQNTPDIVTADTATSTIATETETVQSPASKQQSSAQTTVSSTLPTSSSSIDEPGFAKAHASPSVRKFARELGADLGRIQGSGRKGRILTDDVKAFIKQILQSSVNQTTVTSGTGIPTMPVVDFSQFGEIEEQKLSRINILTGEAMTRNWLNIPHVTQHDLADVTELEQFRKSLKPEAEKKGVRVTMLAFLMKALVTGMKELPRFNSSLSSDSKTLILKKYFNIGIAVDTPNGLVVPVIKNVDQKGIYELSSDLMAISLKAREGKLTPKDMSGGSMTISSLGGIGGHYFTPIVNAPEVAILGVSRSRMQPVWNDKEFEPRLLLPLSLSYDHRVIDGADGARMIVLLSQILADMKRTIL